MTRLSEILHKLGTAQGNRHVLPILAQTVAEAAARGEIKLEDALEVYVDYFKASSNLKNIDPYDNGVKANVSKLRQIIKAADPKLLGRVTAAHARLARTGEARPLYQAMVNVCRLQNEIVGSGSRRKPTNAEIAKLCRR